MLFSRVCRPVAVEQTPGAWYRRWRMVAVDGTVFDVPDTAGNAEFFGRPGSSRGQGRGAYPQARVAALAECGTHAVFAAEVGPLSVHETVLARRLFPALGRGHASAGGPGFSGLDLWRAARASGADLLWRVRSVVVLPVVTVLPDGSYLSEIVAARDHYRRADPERVRVMEYTLRRRGHGLSVDHHASWTRKPHRPRNWPRSTPSGGKSRPRWTRSRTIRATRARPAFPAPARGRAGDLRFPTGASRSAGPDAPGRPHRRTRSGPDLLHPHPAYRPPPRHRTGGAFPPPDSPAPLPRACVRSPNASCPHGG